MSVGNIGELIAKKNYGKAIEAIRAQLKTGKHNPQLHIQLADVLVLAKKPKEGIQILLKVADEFAHDGFEAKAIAVLKKVDKIEPNRPDVQSKLRSLVKKPAAPPPPPPPVAASGGGGGFEIGMEEIGFEPPGGSPISVPAAPVREPEPPPPVRARTPEPELPSFAPAPGGGELDLGFDSGPALDLGLDARPAAPPPVPVPKPAPKPAPPAARPAPRPAAPPPAPKPPAPAPVQDLDFGLDETEEAPAEELPLVLEPEPEPVVEPEPLLLEPEAVAVDDIQLEPEAIEAVPEVEAEPILEGDGTFDDNFAEDLMSAFEEAFSGDESEAPATAQPAVVRGDFMSNPLFQGFDPDTLVAILEGLTLHTFEPGDIIISQGDPGHSLFILSSGTVKAFVNNKYVRDLEEGTFFGEAAILTGQPRTATITAKTRCELLELDRGTLDAISIAHPHVTQVLQEFHQQRMKGK